MYNRKRLDRERLEVYLVQLLLAYRPFLLVGGLLLLGYALATMFSSFLLGSIFLLVAAVPLLCALSYPVVVFTARLGAWMATLGRKN
jgi:pheromone shutdown protein TraB